MSEMGQKAKYSLRADVFRFTPGSRHTACGLGCPSCARIGSRVHSSSHWVKAIRAASTQFCGAITRPIARPV